MDERRIRQRQARTARAGSRKARAQYKQNKAAMLCVTVILLCLLLGLSSQILKLREKNESYKIMEQQRENELEAEQERQEEIAAYEQYVTTQEYIEELAKTKLGLVHDNEIIFKEKKPEE